jgi:hypothetical protein
MYAATLYNVYWSVYLAGFSHCSVKSSRQLQLSLSTGYEPGFRADSTACCDILAASLTALTGESSCVVYRRQSGMGRRESLDSLGLLESSSAREHNRQATRLEYGFLTRWRRQRFPRSGQRQRCGHGRPGHRGRRLVGISGRRATRLRNEGRACTEEGTQGRGLKERITQ